MDTAQELAQGNDLPEAIRQLTGAKALPPVPGSGAGSAS